MRLIKNLIGWIKGVNEVSASNFPGNLEPFNELETQQREFLIEHYKRCEAFWRHWTPTIWSIPSVAAAINITSYSFVFDSSKNLDYSIKIIALFILLLLNIALTIGACKVDICSVYLRSGFLT